MVQLTLIKALRGKDCSDKADNVYSLTVLNNLSLETLQQKQGTNEFIKSQENIFMLKDFLIFSVTVLIRFKISWSQAYECLHEEVMCHSLTGVAIRRWHQKHLFWIFLTGVTIHAAVVFPGVSHNYFFAKIPWTTNSVLQLWTEIKFSHYELNFNSAKITNKKRLRMFNCKKLLITSFVGIKRKIVREKCEQKA